MKLNCNYPDVVERIRNRVNRVNDPNRNGPSDRSQGFLLAGPPRHIAEAIHANLNALPKLVAPRVCAAVFRTIFNGWCTERRFKRRHLPSNRCVLGCGGEAEDSIEHYCCCPPIVAQLQKKFHIRVPTGQLLSLWMMKETRRPDLITSFALIVYAAYNATNIYRHGNTTTHEVAEDCIRQLLIQGVAGHPRSTRFLQDAYQRPWTQWI